MSIGTLKGGLVIKNTLRFNLTRQNLNWEACIPSQLAPTLMMTNVAVPPFQKCRPMPVKPS